MGNPETRAPRNRTISLSAEDTGRLRKHLLQLRKPSGLPDCIDRTILGDAFTVLGYLPPLSIDLLIVDPPYNLTKEYNGSTFSKMSDHRYDEWMRSWLTLARPLLKPTASVYICSEWRTSHIVQAIASEFFMVRNRITWEREKGRGAQHNWKNCSEDIWFCTVSDDYWFDVEAVKLKRRVVAPYRNENGDPKDWTRESHGDFRLTHPSNMWTDISIPFWSMPENTEHPTQKPEKLVAKLMLASSRPGDVVLDPFLGSGTTSVVARKLGRHFIGIEREEQYCLLAERRLELAEHDAAIQGYSEGHFWERNTLTEQKRTRRALDDRTTDKRPSLFEQIER
ncbi:MAG TPA: site-specific DNA-methyltransferase [Candidatus Kapabacteria bacterium]|nr:site-specific DNA-methyltransferase [Candidatus Kapabacteria bacterium]